jgi:NADH-quinone oxidoreductase subunit E
MSENKTNEYTIAIQLLSYAAKSKIDQWLTKFPKDKRQSAVLYALKVVQEEQVGGYLSEAAMDAVAAYLGMPKIAVYEVASFYSLFELSPVGRHKISVCTNISCMLNNCEKIMQHLKDRLGIEIGETTEDGRFTLKEVECLCACGGAPVMQVGDHYHENLTPEKVDRILAELE